MERRNDIPNLLAMYIRNTSEIYNITSWLQSCVIKKANKGIQPQVEYLANCSDENYNQRSRQTVIQVRRNNTHQTGKTGSGPGARQIYP